MASNGWTYLRQVIKSEGGILRLRDRPTGAACKQEPKKSTGRHEPLFEQCLPTARSNQSHHRSGAREKSSSAVGSLITTANNFVVTPGVPVGPRLHDGQHRVGGHIRHVMALMVPTDGCNTPVQARVEEAVLQEINGALVTVLDKSGVGGAKRERTLSGIMRLVETELVKLGIQLNSEQFAECMVDKSQNDEKFTVCVQFQVCNVINSRIEVVDVKQAEYVLVN